MWREVNREGISIWKLGVEIGVLGVAPPAGSFGRSDGPKATPTEAAE